MVVIVVVNVYARIPGDVQSDLRNGILQIQLATTITTDQNAVRRIGT